jgi:hypothetical protein
MTLFSVLVYPHGKENFNLQTGKTVLYRTPACYLYLLKLATIYFVALKRIWSCSLREAHFTISNEKCFI